MKASFSRPRSRSLDYCISPETRKHQQDSWQDPECYKGIFFPRTQSFRGLMYIRKNKKAGIRKTARSRALWRPPFPSDAVILRPFALGRQAWAGGGAIFTSTMLIIQRIARIKARTTTTGKQHATQDHPCFSVFLRRSSLVASRHSQFPFRHEALPCIRIGLDDGQRHQWLLHSWGRSAY